MGDGAAVLLWARPAGRGHDLLLAVRDVAGALDASTRINRAPTDARFDDEDEARPALTTDGSGRIGVAWIDVEGRLWMTRSTDRGATFAAAVRADEGPGAIGPVHAAFGPDGTLHVVWLQPNGADDDAPLHVHHRSWGPRGRQSTTDLTFGHFDGVCASRPFVRADRFGVEVVFRAVDDAGYHVHRMHRERGGTWAGLEAVGPPREGADCPTTAAITDGRTVLWRDADGDVVDAAAPDAPVRRLARGDGLRAPRWITSEIVLVPGDPAGLLLTSDGGHWSVVRDDLPSWCVDLAPLGDEWLMVGDDEGKLKFEALVLTR